MTITVGLMVIKFST